MVGKEIRDEGFEHGGLDSGLLTTNVNVVKDGKRNDTDAVTENCEGINVDKKVNCILRGMTKIKLYERGILNV